MPLLAPDISTIVGAMMCLEVDEGKEEDFGVLG